MNKISPEKIVEIMRKHGKEVSLEQAIAMLELMRKLAKIVVSQYLKK